MTHSTLVRLGAAAAAAAAIAAAAALPSGARSLPDRTERVSGPPGGLANGTSANAFVASGGDVVAFDSTATNLTSTGEPDGAVRDVFTFNRRTRRTVLVSEGLGGTAANGPSAGPVLTRTGGTVVFASTASNLVEGDTNGRIDLFLRHAQLPIERVSLGAGGVQADGDSGQPDVSGDGHWLVFTSAADNLVAGDTNGQPDVFLRDLRTGAIRRVSHAAGGGPANGRSDTPAISYGGRYVTYESTAANIVHHDTNNVGDVFLYDAKTGHTERVSVSGRGHQQNAAVAAPFTQVSDVSNDGRLVVFDSDATNLVQGDANRDTDVFVRDRERRRTERISVNSSGVQGDNDSFAPSITPDGRFVAFESFAGNLVPTSDGPREDVFVYDRVHKAPIIASVASNGAARGAEVVPQLLQRPTLSLHGRIVAFASSAANVTPGDTNGQSDVFARVMDAPRAKRPARLPRFLGADGSKLAFTTDDPAANRFLCRIDRGPQFDCDPAAVAVPRGLRSGVHRLRVTPGGPGMLFARHSLKLRFRADGRPPHVRIGRVTRQTASGTARDDRHGSGVAKVEVAIAAFTHRVGRCLFYDGQRLVQRSCAKPIWLAASGRTHWRIAIPRSSRPLIVVARAVDRSGNVGPRVHD